MTHEDEPTVESRRTSSPRAAGLLQKKKNGLPIAKRTSPAGGNVVDLMSALKASLKSGGKSEPASKPAKAAKKATTKPKRKAG